MNIKDINQGLNPYEVLRLIGHEPSNAIQSGKEIRDFCPLHFGDSQRSLAINSQSNKFKCHNCDKCGDLVGLYAQSKGLSDYEAAMQLKEVFSLDDQTTTSNSRKTIPNNNPQKNYTEQEVTKCWNDAKDVGDDTYFKYKNLLAPPIAKFGKNPKGYSATMAKFTDIDGNFRGFVSLDAEKKTKFNYLANETGNSPRFTLLGTLEGQGQCYIGEGIATMQTAWEATERLIPAIASGSWTNILPVLTSVKEKYPQINFVLLIDLDDQENGLKAARLVKEKYPQTKLRTPKFTGLPNKIGEKPKDFNDLVSICGQTFLDVKNQLKEDFMLPADIIPAKKTEFKQNEGPVVNALTATSSKEGGFEYLLEPTTKEWLQGRMQTKTNYVKTGHKIGELDVDFHGGAISIIAMPTSHGKTTVLVNYTLGFLEQESNANNSVAFFTYEESAEAVLILFMNTWISKKLLSQNVNEPLSTNNRRAIRDHYYCGSGKFSDKVTEHLFRQYEKDFFDEVISSNRLILNYTDMQADNLVKAIKYLKQKANVSLVVIDYIQLIKLTAVKSSSRQEEVKEICVMLKDCVIETGVAIVLAAQFNRTVNSVADLKNVNLGEAGDLERIADFIIGGFNLQDGSSIDEEGKIISKANAIFLKVMKGRKTGIGFEESVGFDGNRGLITNKKKDPNHKNTDPIETIEL